ncbi:Alpha/Beta hydrolase protein [Xylariaceae sp. FL0804]|nr:Alpha/Beta hydrolase protein [Xylariaceae sp. FL0804]
MAQTKYFHASATSANTDAAAPSESDYPTLAYRTFGSPGRPAILMPTCYGGKLDTTLPFLYTAGADGTSAPLADYFVIVCALLGGGESSSPSNAAAHQRGSRFPRPSYADNVRLQHALCGALGVTRLEAYVGFSMGGQQAYHMAALFPDFAARIVVLAGSARTSWHNWSFLEGPKAALVNSVDWCDGEYGDRPARRGTRAFARVYATWALCPEWFRQRCWESVGFATLEEYLVARWEGGTGAWDAHDLLCLLQTWQRGDISQLGPDDDEHRGDLPHALARIKAKALIMPSRTDMYFPPEDSEEEFKHLRDGRLRVIESIWGHMGGGGGGTAEDNEFIKKEIVQFLAE